MDDIFEGIRIRQAALGGVIKEPPQHRPEILYIGCIDARLDPITDIGIPKGKALIFRNIAALVPPNGLMGHKVSAADAVDGVFPENVSVGAALEFFLNHIPIDEGKIKHIAVAAHTDCGGLKACCAGKFGNDDSHLSLYLNDLNGVRAKVMRKAAERGWNDAEILKGLERHSVRQSLANLETYSAVQRALDEGRVNIHGLIIETGTHFIHEMDHETGEFLPMRPTPQARAVQRHAAGSK